MMIGKRKMKETPIPKASIGNILAKRNKEVEELIYEQRLTLEHIKKFTKLKKKAANDLMKELLKINEKIKPRHAVKVVDLLPKDESDVKSVFAKERFALTKDEVKEILGVVSKYS